ncbi:MAG TPA: universal stress protein [Nitrosopumilaceae archaeon]|nr:universal stress protein [Nitrosopumilaceae archaeon]
MIKKKIKKILVPIDGSKNSFRGLDKAISLARQCQATITGLYIMPIYPRSVVDAFMPFQIHFTKSAKKYMKTAKNKAAKKGVVFKSKIVYGSPIMEITDMASKKKFDLIVIGSRGLGGVKEVFLGSVAHGVVHRAKVPVLVVK